MVDRPEKRPAKTGRDALIKQHEGSTDETLLIKLVTILPYLIGMWRFREYGQPRSWCVTFCIDGEYYDTRPHTTLEGAIDDATRDILVILESLADNPNYTQGN